MAGHRDFEVGAQSAVGVPIVVGTHLWGVVVVLSRTGPLPAETEGRIADFADLVGTSIANAATRFELQTSRDSLRNLARQQTALRRVAELTGYTPSVGRDSFTLWVAIALGRLAAKQVEGTRRHLD